MMKQSKQVGGAESLKFYTEVSEEQQISERHLHVYYLLV